MSTFEFFKTEMNYLRLRRKETGGSFMKFTKQQMPVYWEGMESPSLLGLLESGRAYMRDVGNIQM